MSSKFSDIVGYFSKIASQHLQIGHTDSERHFYRFEIEEVFTGLKKINFPALILEGYRYQFLDNKGDHVMKERTGAFMLIGHLNDIGNYDAMHELWDKLEEICDDIIARIKADKRNPEATAVRDFDLNSVEVTLLANEQDKNYGIRCTFTIASPRPMEVDLTKWKTN